ncbi:hypothetical protein CC86DRAFT_368082 [Ophiobolus disseminans]|uniref:Uncharacterized protein n=1 Tax=Ophiobolus disseminans TaxID=1469910 RepID=A0A6A7AC30_9PLEO|nr:hypothetical protein CC86DRAFT_368082 [Ophiobolus disseminans]
MQSRKRSCAGQLDDDRTQKRTCSNPLYQSSADFTQGQPRNVAPLPQTTNIPPETLLLDVQTGCMHKGFCVLSTPACCACSDKRPEYLGHALRINGQPGKRIANHRATIGNRSVHYCPGCKDARAHEDEWMYQNISPGHSRTEPFDSVLTAVVLWVTCADKVFYFSRSGDYTMGQLRQEVARLMSCNPSSLVAADTDVPVESQNSATFLSYASRIHFHIVGAETSDDVEMTNV